MKNLRRLAIGLATALLFGAGSQGAVAALCSAYDISALPGDSLVAGSPGPISTSDMTFRGSDSDGCSALYDGNNTFAEVQAVATGLSWGTFFDPDLKAENGIPPTDTATYDGIDWTLSYVAGSTSGEWTLGFESDPSVTREYDIIAVLKQANGWAAFLFEDEVFTTDGSGNGTYTIQWCNQGGSLDFCDPTGALSHLSLYFTEGSDREPPAETPEPSSVALAGLALLAVGLVRRRRKYAV
jgi:hypothetical protein